MRELSRFRRPLVVVGIVALVGALASVAAAAVGSRSSPRRRSGSSAAACRRTARRRSGRTRQPPPSSSGRAGASKVNITVGISGTGGGFERFCSGEIDLSDASRPMRLREARSARTTTSGSWRAFTVANDALTVVVSRDNTWATCLTVAELKKIWEPGSKVNSWRDVRASFPNEPLRLFGPGTDSGTFEYFTEAINGRARASRSDYQASEDDNVLVQGVAGTRGGLGYFGFSYFEENQTRLKALQVENPKTGQCVTPSVATAQNDSYKPLARPLFIYAKGSSFRRPEVQAFIAYIFANEKAIAQRARFVPLTTAQLKRARTNFDLALKAASRT